MFTMNGLDRQTEWLQCFQSPCVIPVALVCILRMWMSNLTLAKNSKSSINLCFHCRGRSGQKLLGSGTFRSRSAELILHGRGKTLQTIDNWNSSPSSNCFIHSTQIFKNSECRCSSVWFLMKGSQRSRLSSIVTVFALHLRWCHGCFTRHCYGDRLRTPPTLSWVISCKWWMF